MEEIYRTLGEAKCEELSKQSWSFWHLYELCRGRKSAPVGGVVREGIARDFIRQFLPPGFSLKPGLILDSEVKCMSPQIDAIVYEGVPLLEFTDAIVAEKRQVMAAFEIKTWIGQNDIFGAQTTNKRNADTGLVLAYRSRKPFLPNDGKYILFTFELHSSRPDFEVLERLKVISDLYVVVIRREPVIERRAGKEGRVLNYDESVGKIIEWLRNLV